MLTKQTRHHILLTPYRTRLTEGVVCFTDRVLYVDWCAGVDENARDAGVSVAYRSMECRISALQARTQHSVILSTNFHSLTDAISGWLNVDLVRRRFDATSFFLVAAVGIQSVILFSMWQLEMAFRQCIKSNYANIAGRMRPRKRCEVLWWARLCVSVSVCVCLSERISQEPHARSLPNSLCMLPMAVARSSSVVAICYVLPVLWMTSCF